MEFRHRPGTGTGDDIAPPTTQLTINNTSINFNVSFFERGLNNHHGASFLSSTRIEESTATMNIMNMNNSNADTTLIAAAGGPDYDEAEATAANANARKTYWKLRAWFMALEKIVLGSSTSSQSQIGSGLTSELKTKLREVLTDSTLVKFVENDDFLSAKTLFYSSSSNFEFTKDEIRTINRLITKELVGVINQLQMATGTKSSEELVQTVQKLVMDKNIYETQLKVKMGHLDQNIRNFDVELEAFNDEVQKLGHLEATEFIPMKEKYFQFLKVRDSMIATKLKLETMKEFITAHPMNLVHELEEAYLALLQKIDKFEDQIKEIEAKKAAYESLGSEFKELINEWKELGEKIQSKRWVLNELNMAADLSLSLSLNDTSMLGGTP